LSPDPRNEKVSPTGSVAGRKKKCKGANLFLMSKESKRDVTVRQARVREGSGLIENI
jgi:hypothetical protein